MYVYLYRGVVGEPLVEGPAGQAQSARRYPNPRNHIVDHSQRRQQQKQKNDFCDFERAH